MVAVLAAAAGAGTAVALNGNSGNGSTGVSSNDVPAPASNGNGNGNANSNLNASAVAAKVEPGVVDITSTLNYQSETAEGTGMVLNSNGLVLTNNHVINGATSIKATLVTSGKTYTARVLGYDVTDDVALLQLQNASGLKTVSVGNSSQVTLGTPVLAIGNAGGQGGTPTVAPGIINATNRTITAGDQGSGTTETLHGMLQTSAQIQPGDSGGPLANAAGKVIGMDTAASSSGSESSSSSTMGYAIPINTALSIARQIAAGHEQLDDPDRPARLPGRAGAAERQLQPAAAGPAAAGPERRIRRARRQRRRQPELRQHRHVQHGPGHDRARQLGRAHRQRAVRQRGGHGRAVRR